MDKKYRILIADDEKPARALLTEYVNKIPQLELVDSCCNAMEAMSVMNSQRVDILLSDIQMPDMSGVDMVKNVPESTAVIFTTAYSEYAVQGYELGVVDYLLKPIAFPRFMQAVNKAFQYLDLREKAEQTSVVTEPATPLRDALLVKADRRIYQVKFSDLLYIEGQREYVTFHTNGKNITALYSLKDLEDELPATDFIRIHKSFIISKQHIDFIEGTQISVSGVLLPIGNSYKENVINQLKIDN